MNEAVWKVCSACRNSIMFGAVHWVCSVSTCNRARTALVFCSVACWDSHVATLRHRESWAVEARAPGSAAEAAERDREREREAEPAPARRVVAPPATSSTSSAGSAGAPLATVSDDEVLIVVSRMKKYIKDRSGMSTGDAVANALSLHVRQVCDEAIRAAGADGRKTVLDRDVPRVRK